MSYSSRLFDRLADDYAHRLATPPSRAIAAGWTVAHPDLAGIATPADAVNRAADPTAVAEHRRAVLAALVMLAEHDEAAVDAAFAAVIPGLRAVAARLTRDWQGDGDEIDQAVAAAAWARLRQVASQQLRWPDRVIVDGARVTVRDRLRAEARDSHRTQLQPEPPEPDPGASQPSRGDGHQLAEAADLLRAAIRRGVVTEGSARLVWATRVLGVSTADAARAEGRHPKTVRMQRRRAERALRTAS